MSALTHTTQCQTTKQQTKRKRGGKEPKYINRSHPSALVSTPNISPELKQTNLTSYKYLTAVVVVRGGKASGRRLPRQRCLPLPTPTTSTSSPFPDPSLLQPRGRTRLSRHSPAPIRFCPLTAVLAPIPRRRCDRRRRNLIVHHGRCSVPHDLGHHIRDGINHGAPSRPRRRRPRRRRSGRGDTTLGGAG